MLECVTRFKELSRYGYATVDTMIKRNEKFIGGLKLKLARATLLHLRDPYNAVVEMALGNKDMFSLFSNNKPVEAQYR